MCTSGSTGLSKGLEFILLFMLPPININLLILQNFIAGVCLSHAILLHQATGTPMTGDDVVLSFSTIYWISGLLQVIATALITFCRLMTTERFTPELALDMIEEHRVCGHNLN